MLSIEIIGYLAAACSTISFLPQAWKTIRTKSAKDFSAYMIWIFLAGTILWTTYGLYKGDVPVVACNALITFLFLPIVYYKYRG